ALSTAKRELQAANNNVSLAKSALVSLIGSDNFTKITTDFIKPLAIFSLESLQLKMLQQNNQLKMLSINEKLASTAVKIESSEYFPKVALLGKRSIWKENLPLFKTKWMVGVGAKWNVFDGFKRAHKVKSAKAKIAQVQSLKQQAERNILTYTEKLYNELEKQQNQYFSLTNDLALAEKLKFMRTRAFEEGTGTSIEVIDANLQLSQIQLRQLKTLYLYTITYAELLIQTNETKKILNQL
ncbi:MAG TPA: TolC family protein, partial [Flavobacteriaceae bacterium]|nr:TolC family protein [Flavobacteriaceae bacterium]